MSVIENIDVVMGAKTSELDAAVMKEIQNLERLTASLNGMSTVGAAMTPVAAQIANAVSSYASAIPGLTAASGIFASSSAAIRASMAGKREDIQRLAAAMEKLREKARAAKEEVQAVATPALMDPRGSHIDEALRAGSGVSNAAFMDQDRNGAAELAFAARYGTMGDLRKASIGAGLNGRSAAEQKAYEASIDAALAKTATYKSTWVDTGAAVGKASSLSVAGVAGIAAGVGVAVGGFMALKHVAGEVAIQMKEIDDTADAAKKLGMSFSDLETTRMTAKFAGGMDASASDAAMQKMMINLSEANSTQKGAVFDQLSMMGLDAGRLLQQGPVEAMKQISIATQALKDPTDQLVVAYSLFGKAGAEMVSTLREGPGAIDEMQQKMASTGMLLTQQQVEQVGMANDAWDEMGMIATGAYRQIAAEMSPVMQMIVEQISGAGTEFSGWLPYIGTIVDNTVYFSGALYDGYEAATLMYRTLSNIVTLNWSDVGKDIQSAMSFDTGQKNLDRLNKIRKEAADKSKPPKFGAESDIAQFERTMEAKEAADKEAKEAAKRSKREEEQDAKKAIKDKEQAEAHLAKSIKDKTDALRLEIEALREANQLRMRGAMVDEGDLKTRRELSKLSGGKSDDEVTKLLKEKQALDQQKKNIEESVKASPQLQLIERARELTKLWQSGMITEADFKREIEKKEKETRPEVPNKGAVSGQAGSVEGYKLQLERDKGAIEEAKKQTRIQEAMVSVMREMNSHVQAIQPMRAAR